MAKRTRCAWCPNPLPRQYYAIEGERVCKTCYKYYITPATTCPRCDRNMPLYGYIAGVQVCGTCEEQHRRGIPNGECRQCGKAARLVRGLCSRHYKQFQIAARRVAACIDCGEQKTVDGRGRCSACAKVHAARAFLRTRLTPLWGPLEQSSALAQQLYAHWSTQRSLQRIIGWLGTLTRPVRAALRAIGKGTPPTWASLQPLRRLPGGEQLFISCWRARLIELPRAQTDRIDALLARMEAEGPAAAALTVKRFWRWHLAERVVLRKDHKRVDPTLESDRATLTIAFAFLRYLFETRGRTLETMTNADVAAWMRQAPRSHVPRLRPFLRWLFTDRLVKHRLALPTDRITPGTGAPVPGYHAIQRRARNDTTLPLLVRVALLLITLCARYPHELIELRLSDLERRRDVLWIQFARGLAQPLDGPKAQLVNNLCDERRRTGHLWLFPSKPRPEAHMTSHGLCGLIHAAGVALNLNQLRNAGFRDLLKDFTPTELCEILGMTAGVAHHWRKRGYSLTRQQKAYANKLSRAHRRKRSSIAVRQ